MTYDKQVLCSIHYKTYKRLKKTHMNYHTQFQVEVDRLIGSCRPQTQVYKPLFPAFFSQFLDFSPYEQHIFIHDESSLCFLDLVDLSIHKQRKTQASWVSATDSYGGEKTTSCPPAAFCVSSDSRVCKQPIFCSIILLSYRLCSPEKWSPLI